LAQVATSGQQYSESVKFLVLTMASDMQIAQFQKKVKAALDQARLVLSNEKVPKLADEVHHCYEDKYLLAESLTTAAVASELNNLALIGLTHDSVTKLCEWSQTQGIVLRFRSEERCSFLRKETREVENPTKHVSELSVGGVARSAWTSKTVTTVEEFYWKFEAKHEVIAMRGVGAEAADRMTLASRTGSTELVTASDKHPRPEASVPACQCDVNITWLLRQVDAESTTPKFKIDRQCSECRTPRRNPDIHAAQTFLEKFESWTSEVASELRKLMAIEPDFSKKVDANKLSELSTCLVPVLPLLRQEVAAAAAAAVPAGAAEGTSAILAKVSTSGSPSGTALLSAIDLNQLLAEETRALQEKQAAIEATMAGMNKLATAREAWIATAMMQASRVASQWSSAINYVEAMLRKQVVAAIGKEVSPADFAEYMVFHNRKLFGKGFEPVPFSHAVRRSMLHSPEGTLSIEKDSQGPGGDSSLSSPIVTMVGHNAKPQPMRFPLSASSSVTFTGDRYLHGWLSHRFSGQPGESLKLVARARQFSGYIVLVGRITSATTLDATYAAIVQNKDEITIPLELSTIPTPKEFKNAIQSLSPEQQAFAKAFRSMQLESTLFGVLVVQIKPQLEKVLNLTADSLTKEIKLTQELMQLFIKFQIPSDLLSFDAAAAGVEVVNATSAERLQAVKEHVKAMLDMIKATKEEELEGARNEAHYHRHMAAACAEEASSEEEDSCCSDDDEADCLSHFSGSAMDECNFKSRAVKHTVAIKEKEHEAEECKPPPPRPSRQAQQPPPPGSSRQPQQSQPEQIQGEPATGGVASDSVFRDYTKVPKEMDQKFEAMDTDGSLRPTIIKPAETWSKRAQKALLASPRESRLDADAQKLEKDAAFDLLDALTKSGALPVENASLHIVVAATHCFDKSVLDTVVEDNVNPIDKVERSTLIMASTVHQQPVSALIAPDHIEKVQGVSPMLFLEDTQ